MSAQAWAIVGVIVGAILGGTAQVLSDWLRSRRERVATVRSQQRDAYAALLAAQAESFRQTRLALSIFSGDSKGSELDLINEVGLRAVEAISLMESAAAQVALVGTKDMDWAAQRIVSTTIGASNAKEEDPQHDAAMRSWADARRNFVALAKKDLGL